MTLRENRPAANQGTRGGTAKKSGNPREVEYRLFQKINRALIRVERCGGRRTNVSGLFGRDRKQPASLGHLANRFGIRTRSNWLAKDLKAKLISLALWVERIPTW